jgi:multidrug resistance efflux pump
LHLPLTNRSSLRAALPLLVWLLAVVAAYWLYRQSSGGGQAVGIAEAREFTVSPTEIGRLASLETALGQGVAEGQVLAKLDTAPLQREIAVADAELRELQAKVPAEDRTIEQSDLRAERAFEAELEAAEVDCQANRAASERVQAELTSVRQELVRERDLVARRLTDSRRLKDLEARLATLVSDADAWPRRLQALDNRARSTRARLLAWRADHGGAAGGRARRQQLRPLELRVPRQREYLELLQKRLANMVLRAPAPGRVTTILAREGTVVKPGDPVLVLVADSLQVIAYVEEERAPRIAVGDQALLQTRTSAKQRFEGTVTSIARTVSQIPARFWPSPSRPRWGREVFIQANGKLDPGQAVDITFKSKTPPPAHREAKR